ncbi:TonB-dependent receptor [Tenacibaculum sp. ZS6-P6]|uniref:TonB-dependent receptor n=1 Tax=Tenacibaculum sp. ZS6-P6 TaxID=3447503 RepID=UPI003F9976DA
MTLKKRYIFLAFIFISNLLFSQKDGDNYYLKNILISLEKKHNVKFSYADDIIKNKKVNTKLLQLSFKELLVKLEKQTNLIFKKVSNRYVLILEKDNSSFICGYVKDTYSNQPIFGAEVYLADNSIGTVTNEKGYFELSGHRKTDTLVISLLGYQSKRAIIPQQKNTECRHYTIEEYSSQLNEILITSYLTDGITKSNNGTIEISPQKRGILPGLTEPDVLQSLQLLPDIQSPNETTSGLHIRGGTPDHNLVLFDGIRIYNPAHFFGMISAFNPYIIDKVNIQTSGVNAKFGNHIAGVIDIETDSKIDSIISGGFGTNLTHADAFLKFPLSKNTAIHVAGRRSLTDAFNSITFQRTSDRVFQNTIIANNQLNDTENFFDKDNTFFFNDFHMKLLVNLGEKDKVTLSQLYVNNKLDYRFGNEDESFIQNDNLSIKNFGISGSWNRIWNDNLKQNTTLYYSNYNLDYIFNGEQTVETSYRESSIKKNEIKEFSLKSLLSTSLNNNHQLSFGLEYFRNRVSFTLGRTYSLFPDNDYKTEENNINNTFSVFSEYQFKKNKDFNISLGVRSSYFSIEKKFAFAPRLFLQSKLTDNVWFNISYEKKYQNISQLIEFSTSDFGLENKVWSLSNKEEIPILKADQISAGLVFKNNGWLFDLNMYYKDVDGLSSLSRTVTSDSDIIQNGQSRSKGITMLFKKTFDNYTTWMSYSLGATDFSFPLANNGISFPDDNDIRHSYFWSHSYQINQFNFSLGWNYRTGTPFTQVSEINENNSQDFIIDKINGERLSHYHRLDFSTTYKFNLSKKKRWKGKLGVSFLNLYNRRNKLQKRFFIANDGSNNTLENEETFSLGFTPNAVFRLEF